MKIYRFIYCHAERIQPLALSEIEGEASGIQIQKRFFTTLRFVQNDIYIVTEKEDVQ
jgi:hypothetical protein